VSLVKPVKVAVSWRDEDSTGWRSDSLAREDRSDVRRHYPFCQQRAGDCHLSTSKVHSRYERAAADLPWEGIPVRLSLQAPKFFCPNSEYHRRIFCERLPEIVARYAHRTDRLNEAFSSIGFALGGRPEIPMFRQPAAASRNASGGSSNETNSPGRTPRIVCVEISERINASPRLLSNHASLVQRRARRCNHVHHCFPARPNIGEWRVSSALPLPRYICTPQGMQGSKLRTTRMMSIPLKLLGPFSSKMGVPCTASS
jgi:hypothetical protein